MTVWHPTFPADTLARVLRDGGCVADAGSTITLTTFSGEAPAWFAATFADLVASTGARARARPQYGPALVAGRPAAARGCVRGDVWVRLLGLTLTRRVE